MNIRYVKNGTSMKVAGTMLVASMLHTHLNARLTDDHESIDLTSNFKHYFDAKRSGFDMVDCKDDLLNGRLGDDKDALILVEPFIYNEKFLTTIHEIVSRATSMDGDLKVYYLTLSELTPDERDKLNSMLSTNMTEETLFLLRRAGNLKFDPLFFSKYFRDTKYVETYFEKLKLITDKNRSKLMGMLDSRLFPDQIFIVAMLDEDESNRRQQIDRLKQLKTDSAVLNSASVGVVAIANDWLRGKPMKSGDLAILQSRHYTRELSKEVSGEDRSFLADGYMVTTVPGGIDCPDVGKSIADTYYATNVFYHAEMIENTEAKYLVKCKVDRNTMSLSSIRKTVERMRTYRACLRDKNPELYASTVFLMESGAVNGGEDEELMVTDVSRSDIRTMFCHIVKDKPTRDKVLERNAFLKDDTLTFGYKLDPDCGPGDFLSSMKKIDNLEYPHFYRSEDERDWKISRHVVGSTFHHNVINNDKDQAVYFYSDHCFGCKKFGKHFEELAMRDMISPPKGEIGYSRINNSLNHLGPDTYNFQSTPVFALYRRHFKDRRPQVYRQPYLTGPMLFDFYDVSLQFDTLSDDVVSQIFSNEAISMRQVDKQMFN